MLPKIMELTATGLKFKIVMYFSNCIFPKINHGNFINIFMYIPCVLLVKVKSLNAKNISTKLITNN